MRTSDVQTSWFDQVCDRIDDRLDVIENRYGPSRRNQASIVAAAVVGGAMTVAAVVLLGAVLLVAVVVLIVVLAAVTESPLNGWRMGTAATWSTYAAAFAAVAVLNRRNVARFTNSIINRNQQTKEIDNA